MKITDQTYHCQLPGQVFGVWQLQCRLRIFQPHPQVRTVMITDMGLEMNWFIPYRVETLVDQIVHEFYLNPADLIWIEHYTSSFKRPTCANFNQVTFEWQNGCATNPRWRSITAETAQALINQDLQEVELAERSFTAHFLPRS